MIEFMKKNAGFSLIELMIAIVIVSIIAAIAIPTYNAQVTKSRRATAQSDLLELAQFMERTFTENMSFMPNNAAPALPFIQSPRTGTSYYTITISNITASTYTLRATTIGTQVGNGNMELDNNGNRRWDANADGSYSATENVWK